MEIDIEKQIFEIAQAFDVRACYIKDGKSLLEEADYRIYEVLGLKLDLKYNLEAALSMCELGTLYIIKDMYALNNFVLKYNDRLIKIGPFITDDTNNILPTIMEQNKIPDIFKGELQELYNTYPIVRDETALENLISMEMGYLFENNMKIQHVHLDYKSDGQDIFDEMRLLDENKLSLGSIEARYNVEDRLLRAVASGDYEKVISVMNEFANYRISPRVSNDVRNAKNSLIVLNTLLRKAVQEVKVHPAHIDSISAGFAKKIENTNRLSELNGMSAEMTRKYCLLAKNYSLTGHSDLVRNAMNYIDFNLQDDLSLNSIAERLAVNPSYLSKMFKKENNKTLTDYVNEKRIAESFKFLTTTDLPIQKVAEQVGIYDENYFSRLFKKYQNITPSKYRSMMRND